MQALLYAHIRIFSHGIRPTGRSGCCWFSLQPLPFYACMHALLLLTFCREKVSSTRLSPASDCHQVSTSSSRAKEAIRSPERQSGSPTPLALPEGGVSPQVELASKEKNLVTSSPSGEIWAEDNCSCTESTVASRAYRLAIFENYNSSQS